MCEKLVPFLLEEQNIPVLLWLLKNLSDFPESALTHILTFCLDAPENAFEGIKIEVENGRGLEALELDGE